MPDQQDTGIFLFYAEFDEQVEINHKDAKTQRKADLFLSWV